MLLHFQSTHEVNAGDVVVNAGEYNQFEKIQVQKDHGKKDQYLVKFGFNECSALEIHATEEQARKSIADKLTKLGFNEVEELVAALNFRES